LVKVNSKEVTLVKDSVKLVSVDDTTTVEVWFSKVPAGKFTVTTSLQGTGSGTVSPENPVLDSLADQEFTFTANDTSTLDLVLVDGTEVTLTAGKYTITGIYQNMEIEVWFGKKSVTKTIPADFNGNGTVGIEDFATVSEYWYKSAANQTGFVELAPDVGTFETPDIKSDNRFDYKDLNRFVQFCYWDDAKSSGGSIIRGSRSEQSIPVTVSAIRKKGTVTVQITAESAKDVSAAACRLVAGDESAIWREGSFVSRDAQSLAMRGKSGIAIARLSETSNAISGSGLIATAQLASDESTIGVEVVLVDSYGKTLSGVVSATVSEDSATGVKLILAPNPFTVDQPISIVVQSENDPVVSAEAMIYDPVGNRLFHESATGRDSSISFEWNGTAGTTGSFCTIVKYATQSGKSGLLTGMIGHRR